MRIFKYILLLLLVSSPAFAGTAHYFDPDTSATGYDGTYANPFKTMAHINGHTFATGDDLYLKAGSTYTVPAGQYLSVDWSGTSGDHVVIGAYTAEGVFGYSGSTRPILDGNWVAPAIDSYSGTVNVNTQNYIDIEDLRLDDSGYYGIAFNYANYSSIKNCYIYRTYYSGGIMVARSHDVVIGGDSTNGNTLTSLRYSGSGMGAGIEITGIDAADTTYNVLCSYNRVDKSAEGIGCYGKARDIIVEHNVVRDCYSYYIYSDTGNKIEIRYNILYRSATGPNATVGIGIDQEDWHTYSYTDTIRVYGNMVANITNSFMLANQENTTPYLGIRVFNNTFVDPASQNFQWWVGSQDFQCKIVNNISYLLGGTYHSYPNGSPTYVTWGNNNFSTSVTGNAATNAVVGAPTMYKTTGWDTITADTEDTEFWSLLAGSNCIDAATYLTTISSGSGTSMVVVDPFWFGEGMFISADNDKNGTADWVDTVASVNYSTSTVTMTNSHTYTATGYIYLAQSATVAWSGSGPDIGASEYISGPGNSPPSVTVVSPGNQTLYADGGAGWNNITCASTVTDPNSDSIIAYLWEFFSTYLTGGDMETTPLSNWTAYNMTLADETTIKYTGGHSLKTTVVGALYPTAYQAVTTEIGANYRVTGWAYKESGINTYLKVATATDGSGYIEQDDGFAAATWEQLTLDFTATATTTYVMVGVWSTGTVAYFDDITMTQISEVEDPGTITIPALGSYPGTVDYQVSAQDAQGLWSTPVSFTITQEATTPAETECAVNYNPTLTADGVLYIGEYSNELPGTKITPSSNMSVCAIDVYNTTPYGTINAADYTWCRICTINGSGVITGTIATSDASKQSNTFVNNTWISANIGMFTFATPAALTSGTTYKIVFLNDNDANPNDQPEGVTGGMLRFGIDDENNGDSIQTGLSMNIQSDGSQTWVDAEDDLLIKVHTQNTILPVLVDIIGISPDGSYKAGSSIIIAATFDIAGPGLDADTIVCETGATDTTFTHSYPAQGVSAQTHYYTGTVQASTTSADLSANTAVLNGQSLTIPGGHNLSDNAAIVIDTTAPTWTGFYLCDSEGTQITATTTYKTGDTFYAALVSSEALTFSGAAIGNLAAPIVAYPANFNMLYSSVSTTKTILSHTVAAGERTTDAVITGVGDLDFNLLGNTVTLQDAAGNAVTGNLPNAWLVNANACIIAGEGPWTIGTGGDFADLAAFETATDEVPGDTFTWIDTPATSLEITTLTTGTEANPIVIDLSGDTLDVPWAISGNYLQITTGTVTAPGYIGGTGATATKIKAQ